MPARRASSRSDPPPRPADELPDEDVVASADGRGRTDRAPSRRSTRASAATTLGGILAGFDEQVWSRQPPPQERVEQTDRARTVVTTGGLIIELPGTEDDPGADPEDGSP